MASFSYPSPEFEAGNVSEVYYERLSTAYAADGLIGLPTDPRLVYGEGTGGLQVKLDANRRALVRGFMYETGASVPVLSIGPNTSGSTRIDLVVLRLDRSTWTVREAVRPGVPGGGVPSPVQTDAGLWELPVANVTVANNATQIIASAVTTRAWYIDDGRFIAEPNTLPPHFAGRQVLEWDTSSGYKRQLLSDGSAWKVLWEDTGDQESPMVIGWTQTVNTVRRYSGLVTFALSARRHPGGTLAANGATHHVATVPAGFRPSKGIEMPVYVIGGGSTIGTVAPTGFVTVRAYVPITFSTSYVIFSPTSWVAAG